MVAKSRGYGKTWLTALCCIAMGVLYPGSLIAVVSGTAEQATLIVKKIQDYFIRNPEIMREIQCDGHRPVQLSRNKGICTLKNGSKIESYSVGTMRGNRAKIMVIDESPEVKADDLDAVIGPVRNTKRDTGGTIIYDTARTNQHKDRYSALAMAVRYIAELEEARKRRLLQPAHPCVGVVSRF